MGKRAFSDIQDRDAFLGRVETALREGRATEALFTVHQALEKLSGVNDELVKLAMTTSTDQLALLNWDRLGGQIARYEAKFGKRITALGINMNNPVHRGMAPDYCDLETNYYCDYPVPFSTASRAELAKAKHERGPTWHKEIMKWDSEFIEVETLIELTGMEALYEASNPAYPARSDDSIGDLGALASASCAVLLHQAVKNTIREQGLPRPMTVIVGANDHFPDFEAPAWVFNEK